MSKAYDKLVDRCERLLYKYTERDVYEKLLDEGDWGDDSIQFAVSEALFRLGDNPNEGMFIESY